MYIHVYTRGFLSSTGASFANTPDDRNRKHTHINIYTCTYTFIYRRIPSLNWRLFLKHAKRQKSKTSTHTYIYIYTHIYIQRHPHIYIYVYVHIHIHTYKIYTGGFSDSTGASLSNTPNDRNKSLPFSPSCGCVPPSPPPGVLARSCKVEVHPPSTPSTVTTIAGNEAPGACASKRMSLRDRGG